MPQVTAQREGSKGEPPGHRTHREEGADEDPGDRLWMTSRLLSTRHPGSLRIQPSWCSNSWARRGHLQPRGPDGQWGRGPPRLCIRQELPRTVRVYTWGCVPPLSNSTIMGRPLGPWEQRTAATPTLPDRPTAAHSNGQSRGRGAGTRSGGCPLRARRARVGITDRLHKNAACGSETALEHLRIESSISLTTTHQ